MPEYTARDCIVLKDFLAKNPWGLSEDTLFYYELNVLDSLRKGYENTDNVAYTVNRLLNMWIVKAFLDMPIRYRIVRFVFECPLDDVPLYVNEDALMPFVGWRLRISK